MIKSIIVHAGSLSYCQDLLEQKGAILLLLLFLQCPAVSFEKSQHTKQQLLNFCTLAIKRYSTFFFFLEFFQYSHTLLRGLISLRTAPSEARKQYNNTASSFTYVVVLNVQQCKT